jgi:predicted RNA-binding protein with PUA-like domain
MRVASDALPDMSALEITDEHFDTKSTLSKPIWVTREMDFVQKFDTLISLKSLKENPLLVGMIVTQK